jgi:hypothetical protein
MVFCVNWSSKRTEKNLCTEEEDVPSLILSVSLLNKDNTKVPGESIEKIKKELYQEPELVSRVREILSKNNPRSVELCGEGIGGTYFIRDRETEKKIAVFKPYDEEPGAIYNPKEKQSNPLLPPGKGYLREVAAYLLDHEGFAGVPETHLVCDLRHSSFTPRGKQGSLQRFIENTEDQDISSSRFSIMDVHKIGILDVRLFNMDRNMENLLIESHSNPRLIPIDHTYILPPRLDFVWFEWQYWKQAKQPFSEEHLSYINSLDILQDASILQKLGIEESSIRTMMISTTLLKIAAIQFGLNLFQIASLITRKKPNELSDLEKMVKRAEELIEDKNMINTTTNFPGKRPNELSDLEMIVKRRPEEMVEDKNTNIRVFLEVSELEKMVKRTEEDKANLSKNRTVVFLEVLSRVIKEELNRKK